MNKVKVSKIVEIIKKINTIIAAPTLIYLVANSYYYGFGVNTTNLLGLNTSIIQILYSVMSVSAIIYAGILLLEFTILRGINDKK